MSHGEEERGGEETRGEETRGALESYACEDQHGV